LPPSPALAPLPSPASDRPPPLPDAPLLPAAPLPFPPLPASADAPGPSELEQPELQSAISTALLNTPRIIAMGCISLISKG
jgi:hypothetical protein